MLKRARSPNQRERFELSSFSAVTILNSSNISMKLPIMNENTVTPNRIIKLPRMSSALETGWKSP